MVRAWVRVYRGSTAGVPRETGKREAAVGRGGTVKPFLRRFYAGHAEITDQFGVPRNNQWGRHLGTDYGLDYEPVYAPWSGDIVYPTGRDVGDYGHYIRIALDGPWEGWKFGVAHLSDFYRTDGYVEAGRLIAVSGSTGKSTGPHAHAELISPDGQVYPIEEYMEPEVPEVVEEPEEPILLTAINIIWGQLNTIEEEVGVEEVPSSIRERIEEAVSDIRNHLITIKRETGLE